MPANIERYEFTGISKPCQFNKIQLVCLNYLLLTPRNTVHYINQSTENYTKGSENTKLFFAKRPAFYSHLEIFFEEILNKTTLKDEPLQMLEL